jgi:hypothetical protein
MATYAREAKKPPEQLTTADKDAVLHRFALDHKVDSEGKLTGDNRASLVATVLKYPSVYHDLTDTTKGAIAGDLAAQGFTGFDRRRRRRRSATAERWRASSSPSSTSATRRRRRCPT